MMDMILRGAINLGYAGLMLAVGYFAIKYGSMLLHKALAKAENGKYALVVRFVTSVAEKVAWTFVVVMVLEKLGVDIGPIIAGLGVTGFVLGFAFQESLGSLASGMMIAINQPFKVGDFVNVSGNEGTITALDMMAVTLATPDNRKITIPNKAAWGQPIINYSALDKRRVEIIVGIAYGADISLAKSTALETVKAIPGVLEDPAPMAEVKSLDDSAVTLTVRCWTKTPDFWKVYFAGVQSVKEAFDKVGVEIPFRQMDLYIKDMPKQTL
ncbi:MAG: mechanosensitive ion channel family protein [Kiritimatiellae bacterium]|jgi:small conductance mechanosensitive channel|nr:mechanosensitive ion channel family protein [Kiritimatiellia bacterium]MBR4476483.1 mechanosensitive ion channel family protein [Kiritimatiellia bacterium]